MDMKLFKGRIPKIYPETDGAVLHVPRAFNFRIIDGVIVRKVKPEEGKRKNRLFVIPLQITVAEKHSDSHKKIFSEWKEWTAGLEEFDVVPIFVWISEKGRKPEFHRKCADWPAHYEWDLSISQVSVLVGNIYNDAKKGLQRQ